MREENRLVKLLEEAKTERSGNRKITLIVTVAEGQWEIYKSVTIFN